ncbi:MAG: hypothetical protein R2857_12765 [Vampirovibrionales bacterium]
MENAASIAGMLLTTEALVVDLPEKETAGAGAGMPGGGMMDTRLAPGFISASFASTTSSPVSCLGSGAFFNSESYFY